MFRVHLGQQIADLRRQRWLTQVQLPTTVGCPVGFIKLVERGMNAPSVARSEDFAKAVNVGVADLFNFAGRTPKGGRRSAA